MNAVVRWMWDLLYPPKCMLCHRLMESSEQLLCGRCDYDMPDCDHGRNVEYFAKTAIAFYYEGNIRNSIHRFKFYGAQSYAEGYARWMLPKIRSELDGTYDLISWVPCSFMRRWIRGYDQAQVLAQKLAEQLGVECVRTLKKVRHTKKQSMISNAAKRRANVLGAYKAVMPERFFGKRILLIDDVLTTGATMSECGKVLRMAGAVDPVCAVIATARRNT